MRGAAGVAFETYAFIPGSPYGFWLVLGTFPKLKEAFQGGEPHVPQTATDGNKYNVKYFWQRFCGLRVRGAWNELIRMPIQRSVGRHFTTISIEYDAMQSSGIKGFRRAPTIRVAGSSIIPSK